MIFIFAFAVFLFFFFLNELVLAETAIQLKWCERPLIQSKLKMSSDRHAGLSTAAASAALALLGSPPRLLHSRVISPMIPTLSSRRWSVLFECKVQVQTSVL